MLFFDQNDIISQLKLKGELFGLNEDKEWYHREIKIVKEELDELLTNNNNLEKFAREKYLMRKPNEDVFVIVEED